VYHFVAYVPVGNKVFELDGLKKAPVYLGDTPTGGEWYQLARQAINRRISKYASGSPSRRVVTHRATTLLQGGVV